MYCCLCVLFPSLSLSLSLSFGVSFLFFVCVPFASCWSSGSLWLVRPAEFGDLAILGSQGVSRTSFDSLKVELLATIV